MAESIMGKVAPAMGGITDEELDLIMCCGGSRARSGITGAQLPDALSIIGAIKADNEHLERLFMKYDWDKSGDLPADQLRPLLVEVSGGLEEITDDDINYVLNQCEPRGIADPIGKKQLKAAIACWYCHSGSTSAL